MRFKLVQYLLFSTVLFLVNNEVITGSANSRNRFFENDDKSLSMRTNTNLILESQKPFTEIKPDDTSSALRLSKEQLGRFSWAVLHSIAAAYPVTPSEDDKNNIVNFLSTFAALFPCKACKGHFVQMLKDNPIKNSNRSDLVMYLCDLHNNVNKRLNKPIFDCKNAFDFWGGNCGCDKDK